MSTAATTRLLRTDPDIYGHVTRPGLRVRWLITDGKTGPTLAAGSTWTRGGAWVAASAAAYKPHLDAGAR